MKRWLGWGDGLITILSPRFTGRGEMQALRGGGHRHYGGVEGHITAGALRRLVEKLV
jgi:hypothetical protein